MNIKGNEVVFEVLTAASMKMATFWIVAPCRLVQISWCIRGAPLNFYQTTRH
jgi:hypothetical protein